MPCYTSGRRSSSSLPEDWHCCGKTGSLAKVRRPLRNSIPLGSPTTSTIAPSWSGKWLSIGTRLSELRRGMSRTKNQYNGRVIHVTSFPLADNRFTVHFDIEKQRDGRIEVTHFESGQSFASDAEAIEAGLKMGRQKLKRCICCWGYWGFGKRRWCFSTCRRGYAGA